MIYRCIMMALVVLYSQWIRINKALFHSNVFPFEHHNLKMVLAKTKASLGTEKSHPISFQRVSFQTHNLKKASCITLAKPCKNKERWTEILHKTWKNMILKLREWKSWRRQRCYIDRDPSLLKWGEVRQW